MFLLYHPYLWVLAAVLGLCMGSFLNVVIHRLPRGESIVSPRSHCPKCDAFIRWYDNIPLLSFLVLGGKCRDCKEKISFRYFFTEFLMLGISLAAYFYYDDVIRYLVYFLLFMMPMVAVIFIDLEHRIIPNVITFPGIAVGLIVRYWDAPPLWEKQALIDSGLGIAVGAGFLFAVAWIYEKVKKREGLGMGDVKLAAMLGAFFGWQGILFILLMASVLGSVVGIVVVLVKKDWLYALPFGPFLAGAAFLHLFFGYTIIDWYLGLVH